MNSVAYLTFGILIGSFFGTLNASWIFFLFFGIAMILWAIYDNIKREEDDK